MAEWTEIRRTLLVEGVPKCSDSDGVRGILGQVTTPRRGLQRGHDPSSGR
jgi:hypothetical protein